LRARRAKAPNLRPRGFGPAHQLSEGQQIRADEKANADNIAPTKTGIGSGVRAKIKRAKFDRFETEICENLDDLTQWGNAMPGCDQKAK
jgi:hypothetical protein